jgi:hypothetical protein
MHYKHIYSILGVIISNFIWFLPTKTTKLKFYKIQKIKPKLIWNQFKPIGFGSVRLFYIKNQNSTNWFWFCSFQFGFGAVQLFYIKNQKLYCFLGFFLNFLMDLGSVWFGFFMFGFFIFRFCFSVSGLWNQNWNRIKYFFKYSNRFFFIIRFFRLLFF